MFDAEMTPTRMTITKVSLVVAAVGVVAAVTFGILELKAESDYDKEVKPSAMDDIAKKGRHTTRILTNVGIVTAARRSGGGGHRRLPAGAEAEREAEDGASSSRPPRPPRAPAAR